MTAASSVVRADDTTVFLPIVANIGQVLVAQNTTLAGVSPTPIARFVAAGTPIGSSLSGVGGTVDVSVTNVVTVNAAATGTVKIADGTTNHLQFFSGAGSAQVTGSAITDFATLKAALIAYGLLSNT